VLSDRATELIGFFAIIEDLPSAPLSAALVNLLPGQCAASGRAQCRINAGNAEQ